MQDIKPAVKEFVSNMSIDSIKSRIVKKLTLAGATVKMQDGSHVECKFGSNIQSRLWGGWFVSKSTLPRTAYINFEKNGNKTKVRVLVKETFGAGLNIGLVRKYEEVLQETADLISELLT